MAGIPGLTGRKSCSDHDIAEFAPLLGDERQHVCYSVFPSVTMIQRADTGIRHDRYRHLAAGAGRRDAPEPVGQPGSPYSAGGHNIDNEGGGRRPCATFAHASRKTRRTP